MEEGIQQNIEPEILEIIRNIYSTHAEHIPTGEQYDKYFKYFYNNILHPDNQKEFQFLKSNNKYTTFENFYNNFKTKLDNEIKDYNKKKNVNLSYDENYDKFIFRRIIKAFHNNNIPVIIKGEDGNFYVNDLFDKVVEKFLSKVKKEMGNKKEMKIYLGRMRTSPFFDDELKNLLKNYKLKSQLKSLQEELDNVLDNLELNKKKLTYEQIEKASEEEKKIRKEIEEIKLELAKKKGNLKYISEIIKQSNKSLSIIAGIIF